MNEFIQLNEEWAMTEKHTVKDEKRLTEILMRMMQLYKGDLMEGNDFGDLIFQERERLRSTFVDACQKLSSLFVSSGELRQAEDILRRAFTMEPYDENICMALLKLYVVQGRKSKAVKLYYVFKKRMEQELHIKIDTKLAEAIRGDASNP